MIETLTEKVAHAPGGGIGFEGYVAVGEEKDVACGRVRSALDRVAFSEPAGGEFRHVEHGEPVVLGTEAIGDLTGAIVGAVVDEDDFEVVVPEGEE